MNHFEVYRVKLYLIYANTHIIHFIRITISRTVRDYQRKLINICKIVVSKAKINIKLALVVHPKYITTTSCLVSFSLKENLYQQTYVLSNLLSWQCQGAFIISLNTLLLRKVWFPFTWIRHTSLVFYNLIIAYIIIPCCWRTIETFF